MSLPFRLITREATVAKLSQALPGRNRESLPRLVKITVSVGTGRAKESPKQAEIATETLRTITGQQPIPTRAKQAIAGFKLRAGDSVGLKVTLRGKRMWDFLNRLVMIAIPRFRDFRGLPLSGLDGQGNYSFGVREHTVFSEVHEESVVETHGLGVVLTTSAATRSDGEQLLRSLGLPFESSETKG